MRTTYYTDRFSWVDRFTVTHALVFIPVQNDILMTVYFYLLTSRALKHRPMLSLLMLLLKFALFLPSYKIFTDDNPCIESCPKLISTDVRTVKHATRCCTLICLLFMIREVHPLVPGVAFRGSGYLSPLVFKQDHTSR